MTDYAKLFDRIPDDIVLAVSARELDLSNPQSCLCGWVVREHLARVINADASEVPTLHHVTQTIADVYGGDYWDWSEVYWGVTDSPAARFPDIERAWVNRLDKAVARSSA